MFYRRMLLDTTETAMMIGEHQPVFRYDYSRTKAAETDNGIRPMIAEMVVTIAYAYIESHTTV